MEAGGERTLQSYVVCAAKRVCRSAMSRGRCCHDLRSPSNPHAALPISSLNPLTSVLFATVIMSRLTVGDIKHCCDPSVCSMPLAQKRCIYNPSIRLEGQATNFTACLFSTACVNLASTACLPRGLYVSLALISFIFYLFLKVVFEQCNLRIYWTDFHQLFTIW